MAIDEIFDCVVFSSCGLCCSAHHLCPTCEVHTLRANGLPKELAPRISGLAQRDQCGKIEYSPLYNKIKELWKEERDKYLANNNHGTRK